MTQIWLVVEEQQNEHGFVDTTPVSAFTTEAAATAAVREYEDESLADGELVTGREDDWPEGAAERSENWTVCYKAVSVSLYDEKES